MSDKPRYQPLRLQGAWSHLTLPGIAANTAVARPTRLAFVDSTDRENWTDGAARTLTTADLQREIDLFARKFATLGLLPGDRIIVMMPNIVEGVSAILGSMLAGFTPCPLSVVSSVDQIVAAARQVEATAVVTVCRYAHLSPAATACEAASQYYGIRFVAAYGDHPPPGVIPLSGWPDDDISHETFAAAQPHHDALVTFDVEDGQPFVRTHAQLVSEALALSATSGLTGRGQLLGTFTPVSAAGVIATIAAPLVSGAQVHLHGPFTPETLAGQLKACPDAILIVPSAAESAVRALLPSGSRDTIVINRDPAIMQPAVGSGRVVELLALGERATWSQMRPPERKRCRLPRSYAHPVATAFPSTEVLILSEASSAGQLIVSGPGIARPFAQEGNAQPCESEWIARGDGPQHFTILSETPAINEMAEATTIAA